MGLSSELEDDNGEWPPFETLEEVSVLPLPSSLRLLHDHLTPLIVCLPVTITVGTAQPNVRKRRRASLPATPSTVGFRNLHSKVLSVLSADVSSPLHLFQSCIRPWGRSSEVSKPMEGRRRRSDSELHWKTQRKESFEESVSATPPHPQAVGLWFCSVLHSSQSTSSLSSFHVDASPTERSRGSRQGELQFLRPTVAPSST